MKIAQVAPLYESVPPKLYGGTERVVSYLTEELVRQGHQVTLFASGDSVTQARLVEACARSLRLDQECVDQIAHYIVLLEQVFRQASAFDLIHFHIDYLHFPLSVRQHIPTVTTLHGRLDLPDLVPLYQMFPSMPVVSISDAQRAPLPAVNWLGTVYHGLPEDLYTFPGDTGHVPGVSGAHIAGEGGGAGDCHCSAGRHATEDCCQGRPARIASTSRRWCSRFCTIIPWWNTLERLGETIRTPFWVRPMRSSFPLIGQSRLAWL